MDLRKINLFFILFILLSSFCSANLFGPEIPPSFVRFDKLVDTNITNVTNNDMLVYDITQGKWINSNSSINISASLVWDEATGYVFLKNNSKNVGIGINNPSQKLVVDSGDVNTYSYLGVRLDNDNRFIKIGNPGSDVSQISVDDNDIIAFGQDSAFVNDGSSFVELMRIARLGGTNSPLVGIGMTNPTATLHVNGSLNVTSMNDICIDGGSCLSFISGSVWAIDNYTLINDSGVLKVNMTYLNSTIDDRDSDTKYTNGTGVLLSVSNIFSLDTNYTNNTYVNNGGDNITGQYIIDGGLNVSGTIAAHNFTGNSPIIFINASGAVIANLSTDGLFQANAFAGDGSQLYNLNVTTINGTTIVEGNMTVNGSLNMSGYNIFNVGNITANEIFALLNASYITNEYWVNVDGDNMTGPLFLENDDYLQVGNFEGLLIKEGRVLAENGVGSNRGYFGTTSNWSSHFKSFDETFAISKSGSDGVYDEINNIFCDSVYNNFSVSDAQQPRKALILTSGDYISATARIFAYINSSCVLLNLNPAWDENLTGVSWITRTGLTINFNDGGSYDFVVGTEEESVFKIGNPGGEQFSTFWINDKSGADQHQGLTIDFDMKGKDGTVAQNIYMYSSEVLTDKSATMLLMEADATQMNNSNGAFIDMEIIGSPIAQGEFDGIRMPAGLDHLIHVGSNNVLSSGYVESVNETYNFITPGAGATLFDNNGDFIYVGNSVNFTNIAFSLSTTSQRNLDLDYYYCNDVGNYELLSGVTDTTNGMLISGTVSFSNPINRGTCNTEFDGTPFSDTNNYTYIAIQRNRRQNNRDPVENLISISGGSEFFILQDDMIKLHGVDGAPEICAAITAGGIYFDSVTTKFYGCDGSNWVAFT